MSTYESADRSMRIEWSTPAWTPEERFLCRVGFHERTRRTAVHGFINYFTPIAHYFCACHRWRWMWFQDGWLPPIKQDTGAMQKYLDALTDGADAMQKIANS